MGQHQPWDTQYFFSCSVGSSNLTSIMDAIFDILSFDVETKAIGHIFHSGKICAQKKNWKKFLVCFPNRWKYKFHIEIEGNYHFIIWRMDRSSFYNIYTKHIVSEKKIFVVKKNGVDFLLRDSKMHQLWDTFFFLLKYQKHMFWHLINWKVLWNTFEVLVLYFSLFFLLFSYRNILFAMSKDKKKPMSISTRFYKQSKLLKYPKCHSEKPQQHTKLPKVVWLDMWKKSTKLTMTFPKLAIKCYWNCFGLLPHLVKWIW